jgi:hypothetical protein
VFIGITGGWSHRKNENNLAGNHHDLLVAEGHIWCNLWRVLRWPR